jgi:uncharacterized iron-regulated protein
MRFTTLLIFVAISACASSAPLLPALPGWTTTLSASHDLSGKIWSVHDRRYVTPQRIAAATARSYYIFLGENHDNPDHHSLQAWVLRAMIRHDRKPAIVFEMIEETRQAALDAYQKDNPTAAGLGAAVEWEKTGWPDWSTYQPIADAALSSGLAIFAGNPAKHGKLLTKDRRERLGLDAPLTPKQHELMLETIDAGHCRLVPKQHLEPMATIQRARDAVLADNAYKAAKRMSDQGAILIVGADHARKDYAAPTVLDRLHPARKSMSVAFIEVDDTLKLPADYAQTFGADTIPFDFVWFTPRANNRDYCAGLKQKFKKHTLKSKPAS